MRLRISLAVALSAITGCSTASNPPAPATPTPVVAPASASVQSSPMVRTGVVIGESYSPRTDDASMRAFVPEIAPVETGGECATMRTGGSGATMVTAYFPSRADVHTQIGFTFDSAGHLIRYSERRGGVRMPSLSGMTDAQRDSAMRATTNAARTTSISFDYAIDQAVALNRGGGLPTNAILGPVRVVEKLEKLGPVPLRQERVRRLCGV